MVGLCTTRIMVLESALAKTVRYFGLLLWESLFTKTEESMMMIFVVAILSEHSSLASGYLLPPSKSGVCRVGRSIVVTACDIRSIYDFAITIAGMLLSTRLITMTLEAHATTSE